MPISKVDLMRAKLDGITSALQKATEDSKSDPISISLAKNFNSILEALAREFPDIAAELPSPLSVDGHFAMMGRADDTYLDLEVYVDQIRSLLALLEAGQ